MLKRIKIEGYKSLESVEVHLQPLSVLFGPNAAGKSNFLDALQLLSRMVSSRTLKEAFEPPYRGKPLESFTFGPGGIDSLLHKEFAAFSIEVDVQLSPSVIDAVERRIREMRVKIIDDATTESSLTPEKKIREEYLRYRIEVHIIPKSGILRVADEYLAPLTAKGEISQSRNAFLEKVENRLHLRMEGQSHPTYHDQYLDYSILSLPLYPPHYPHLVALREELSRYFFYYFEPRERMRMPNPVKEVRHIGSMGEELAAFLNTLQSSNERQFEGMKKSLRMIIPSVSDLVVSVNSLGEVDLWLLESNIRVPARVISEGTLRVLGLLALSGAEEPPALIGFEEPENGVHPRRLRMIADLLKSRVESGDTQLVITTHSPSLLDLIPDKYLFVSKKEGVRTTIEPMGLYSPMFQSDREQDINDALEERPMPSERIMRGDFDV
jgi:predicted ATPase